MNKETSIAVVVAIIGALILFFFMPRSEIATRNRTVTSNIVGETTTFSESGVITFENPGGAGMMLVYEEPGSPALTKKLILDEKSICSLPGGAIPCVALSVTLDVALEGKKVLIEGIDVSSDTVLVRKLHAVEEGGMMFENEPGSTFITWNEAISLIKNCEARMVMQTHALDVYITLDDGRRLRAVEPTIDEVFRVLEESRDICGQIPVATE